MYHFIVLELLFGNGVIDGVLVIDILFYLNYCIYVYHAFLSHSIRQYCQILLCTEMVESYILINHQILHVAFQHQTPQLQISYSLQYHHPSLFLLQPIV